MSGRQPIHLTPTRLSLFILALSAACLFDACGKRRPPLPPVERVPQRTELLSGVQRGNQVILSWPAPPRNAPDRSVQSIRRIDVYRVAEKSNAPRPLTEEEFAARSTLIGSVTDVEIQRAASTLTYTDTLTLTEPVRLRYALRYVNASGERAAFSNFLLIEPASRVSQPPKLARVANERETALNIRWQTPPANVDGSTPLNLLGYNVYRATGAQRDFAPQPRNSSLINGNEFADQTFTFGETYTYVVRAVSLGTGGAPVESLNSNELIITARDIFPPSAPTAISHVAAPGRISLFFPANPERDVVGYNLHRTIDPNTPKPWTKLNRTLLVRTTYQDATVESGVKYYYYLTALDAAGNESPPSEVFSETVP